MFQNARYAMTWLHTWLGLVLGFVLMGVFVSGVLCVFDREIDRWAIPESRFAGQPLPSFDRVLHPVFEGMQPDKESLERMRSRVNGELPDHFDTVRTWSVSTTHRDPVLTLYSAYEVPNAKDPKRAIWGSRIIDPRDGAALPSGQLKIGSQFFYWLHGNLHLNWMDLGRWLVGLAALVMLVAVISGVVIHRRFFRDFFTFRPSKTVQRSTLDLHNLTGVLAMPFYFFFAFTGLLVFATHNYFPVTHTQLKPLHDLHEQIEARETGIAPKRAGVPAPLASVDAMVLEAKHRWAVKGNPGEVGSLWLSHVGDANGTVSIYRSSTDSVTADGEGIHFKASTGEVLREEPPPSAVNRVNEFLDGAHRLRFRHWTLRWLYVLGGLMGCVCIATGFIFFVEKRKRQHARQGSQGSRVVDALAVTTIAGMLIATLGILIANRLLPVALPQGWPPRANVEEYSFWVCWLLAMAHAFWRSAPVAQGKLNPAWREQSWAIAAMALLAVLLNWITTGDHLVKTVFADTYWPVAGVDLSLLVTAGLAAFAARKLGRRASAVLPSARIEAAHA